MERAMPKPWSLYRLYQGGFIFPSQTFHWTSPPHTHTNTNTEFRCWLSLTAKRQQKQQRFETLSVSIDLDATGRWLSINAQIGCFEALHQEIPSSEKFIHRPGKQPPSGSTNRQSENSQQKKQGVTFHLNEKNNVFCWVDIMFHWKISTHRSKWIGVCLAPVTHKFLRN